VTIDPRSPVLVGSGQYLHRATGLDDALDPASLMCRAVEQAAADAGLSGVPSVDSVRVIGLLSWRYGNAAQIVAEQLGIDAREYAYSTMGGNSPQSLVNGTAKEIQAG
jgi:acetyl-CoA C-acetyltransferase